MLAKDVYENTKKGKESDISYKTQQVLKDSWKYRTKSKKDAVILQKLSPQER